MTVHAFRMVAVECDEFVGTFGIVVDDESPTLRFCPMCGREDCTANRPQGGPAE